MAYKSLNKDFSTDAFTVNLSRKIFEDFNLEASYKYRSQPLDFNSYLLESDFKAKMLKVRKDLNTYKKRSLKLKSHVRNNFCKKTVLTMYDNFFKKYFV